MDVGRGDLRVSEVVRLSNSVKQEYAKYGKESIDIEDASGDPQRFSECLNAAREADKRNGWAISPETAEEARQNRLIMDKSGNAGLGVSKDGNITAVFKNPNSDIKHALDTLIPMAIAMGGTKLDCYGEALAMYYSQYGAIPDARVKFNHKYANSGWDSSKGEPYIYVMHFNGKNATEVIADKEAGTYKRYTIDDLRSLPLFGEDDYEAALDYRNAQLTKQQQSSLPQPEASGDIRQSDVYTNSGLRNRNETIRSLNEQQLEANPDVANYKTQTHADTTKAAQARIDQNGYTGEYDRLLNAETWDSADLVEAQMALEQFFKDGEWLVIALRAAASMR